MAKVGQIQGVYFNIVLWADSAEGSAQIGFTGLLRQIYKIKGFKNWRYQKKSTAKGVILIEYIKRKCSFRKIKSTEKLSGKSEFSHFCHLSISLFQEL